MFASLIYQPSKDQRDASYSSRAAVAELEAGFISDRTKRALAAAKSAWHAAERQSWRCAHEGGPQGWARRTSSSCHREGG